MVIGKDEDRRMKKRRKKKDHFGKNADNYGKKTCLGYPLCRQRANFCSRQQKYVEMPAVCVEGKRGGGARVCVRTSYLRMKINL